MTLAIVWSPLALREIASAFDYLVKFNPRAATQVVEALVAAGESLETLSLPRKAGAGKHNARVGNGLSIHHSVSDFPKWHSYSAGTPHISTTD